LALACCLLPAWAQTPPAAKKAHRKATPEQIRKFDELQKKQDPKR
jgi:hypothetical protein